MRGRRLVLLQVGVTSLALLIVVGTAGVVALERSARGEALRQAGETTRALAEGALVPELNAGVVRGDPAAIAQLDRVVRTRVLRGAVVHVKVWTPDGRIVYADERGLMGRRFAPDDDLGDALASGQVHAGVSSLDEPENRFERAAGHLIEVYVPVRPSGGSRLVVETYQSTSLVSAASSRIVSRFLPVLLLALGAVALAQIPLCLWLARRMRTEQEERGRLARRAHEATDQERLRIASSLHDGVVQELAGVAWSLSATADQLDLIEQEQLERTLRQSAAVARDSITALRSLLVELCPPEPARDGLQAAFEELAAPLRRRGLDVDVRVTGESACDDEDGELLYRAAREAVRNAERHAAATRVTIALRAHPGGATLLVEDDGRGMTAADLAEQRAEGHVGLAVLGRRVVARGGRLAISSEPGRGTRLTVELGAPAGGDGRGEALVVGSRA